MTSYGDDQGFTAWLAAQGLQLPADAPTVGVLRAIGSSYVDSAYELMLQCSRRTGGFSQELAWPRTGHRVNGQSVPNDLVPPAWVNASYRAAYLEAMNPGWATGSIDPNRVTKREKVDTLEREFFAAGDNGGAALSAVGMAADGVINGMVMPWLCSTTRSMDSFFRVV